MNTNFNLYIILLNISFLIGYNAIYGECSCKNEVENNNSSSEVQKKTHTKLNVKSPIKYPLTNTESSSTNPKSSSTNPKSTLTNTKSTLTNPKSTLTNPESTLTTTEHTFTNTEPTLTNTEPPLTNTKSPLTNTKSTLTNTKPQYIPKDDNTTNKLTDSKKTVNAEENKKNELIDNLYNEYVEIKKILQYFFKKEIESILDLNITDKESIKNIIYNNGIEYANEKLKSLLNFKNEVWRQNDPSPNSYLYYSEINENSIFAILYALRQSTAIVWKPQSIDYNQRYNIWHLILYITKNDNKANFFNIVPFISNRSDFFYNLCKCISDAGNLSGLKSNVYEQSWGIGYDCDRLDDYYLNFCQNCGSNKNDNENKIIKYFSIKFYDDKREIKNNFDKDTLNVKDVSDFIKKWELDKGN